MSGPRLLAALFVSAACAVPSDGRTRQFSTGDASFGTSASDLPFDGGLATDVEGRGESDDSHSTQVRVRLLHGILNARALEVCYDPDLELASGDDGPTKAAPLKLRAHVTEASDYVSIAPLPRGALTFHLAAKPTAPRGFDAGATGDAGRFVDSGLAGDRATFEAPRRACDPRTREAALPLPVPANWLDSEAPSDLAAIGVAQTLDGGDTITLLGSGIALDAAALTRRADAARASYLDERPFDTAGAMSAAEAQRRALDESLGPRVIPAREATQVPSRDRFSLSLAHLIIDVPGETAGSGALRLCVTTDGAESSAYPSASRPGFAFRLLGTVDRELDPSHEHTFRVFAAEAFDTEAKDCAGTSLAPIAQLTVQSGDLEGGRSYTLAALGAIAPDALCNPTGESPLVRAGCEVPAGSLGARLTLLARAQ